MTVTQVPVSDVPVDRMLVLEEKLDWLAEQVSFLAAEAAERGRQRAMLSEMTADVSGFSGQAVERITELLANAEQKGYFGFATAAAGVADRVVTNFDADDVNQLGDNVVAILQTVREITQPELLTLLGRLVEAVRAEQAAVAIEDTEPPSLWALVQQLRDPAVRRGMGRALHTLRAVSVETGPRR